MAIGFVCPSPVRGQTILAKSADSLRIKGDALYKAGDYHAALDNYREALKRAAGSTNSRWILGTLESLAQTEIQIDSYDSAEIHARFLLDSAHALGIFQEEADALRLLGDISSRKSEYAKAEGYYNQALQVATEAGDSAQVANVVHNLGNVAADQGQFERAIQYYMRSLNINRVLGNIPDIGKFYYNIGVVDLQRGNSAEALSFLDSARTIFERIGDTTQLAMIIGYTGTAYNMQGNYSRALEYLEKGLRFAEAMRDTFGIAVANGNIADVYMHQGFYSRALEYHKMTNALFSSIGNKYNVSASLLNIGELHYLLGEYDKALDDYRKAWELKTEIGDRYGTGLLLGNIGAIFLDQKKLDSADVYFRKSLEIGLSAGDRATAGRAYQNLGSIYVLIKSYRKADKSLREALSIFRRDSMRSEEAETLNKLGEEKLAERKFEDADECYQNALSIGEQIYNPEPVWRAHTGLGKSYELKKHLKEAAEHYREALKLLEGVRTRIGSGDYRASFIASQFVPYEGLIRVLGKMHAAEPSAGYDGEAFSVAERSRAHSFLELLAESKADIRRGLSDAQKIREGEILRNISRLQASLLNTLPSEDKRGEIVEQIREEEENLKQFESELRRSNPLYAALKYPRPADREYIQDCLSEGTVLLEFSLGTEQSFLWLISKKSMEMVQLPSSVKIEKEARMFLKELGKRPKAGSFGISLGRIREIGGTLYSTLFGKVSSEITSAKHLIIVPDGILFYVPFETLTPSHISKRGDQGGSRFLVELMPVTYAQSGTVFTELSRWKNSVPRDTAIDALRYELLAFGDPVVFRKSRKGGDVSGLSRSISLNPLRSLEDIGREISPLPSTRDEVRRIASLFPKGSAKYYLGEDATENNLKSQNLRAYRYIHFATHGFLDEKNPGLGGILFSAGQDSADDGLLQMNEVFNLSLNADAVVLSACQTGLGKLLKGEGMVGLTRAFRYAGAHSVVVSLWNVADASTAKFMEEFYSALIVTRAPGVALREAKLKMMNSSIKLWRHPFHWAGFIIEGEDL